MSRIATRFALVIVVTAVASAGLSARAFQAESDGESVDSPLPLAGSLSANQFGIALWLSELVEAPKTQRSLIVHARSMEGLPPATISGNAVPAPFVASATDSVQIAVWVDGVKETPTTALVQLGTVEVVDVSVLCSGEETIAPCEDAAAADEVRAEVLAALNASVPQLSHHEHSLGLTREQIGECIHAIPSGTYESTTSFLLGRGEVRYSVRVTTRFEILRGWTSWDDPQDSSLMVPDYWSLHWRVVSAEEQWPGKPISRCTARSN